jgi:hypothetical protein
MLNKELLMVGSESLEPVLSIYISPDLSFPPAVSGTFSSGKTLYVETPGETTFKFSEINLTAKISVLYREGTQITTSNLISVSASYSGGDDRAASLMMAHFRIRDRTQSASISLA